MTHRSLNKSTDDRVRIVSPITAWSYEDQKQALTEGFNSVTEWAVWHMARRLEAIDQWLEDFEARVEALEGVHSEGQRVELRGNDEP